MIGLRGIRKQRTYAQSEWLEFTDSFNLDVVWDGTSDSGEPVEPGFYRGSLSVLVREKTKVGPNGGEIAVLAENSADVVWGDKEIMIDQLAAEPEGLEHGQTATVHLMATAIIRGFRDLPQVQWDLKVLSSQGSEVFSRSQSSILAGIDADWEAQKPDGTPLDDGVYQIHVRAEIQDENLVTEQTIPFQVGDKKAVLIEDLTATPNPVDFEEQEPGLEGSLITASVSAVGYLEPFAAPWKIEIRGPETDSPILRTITGTITLDPAQPTAFETFWDGRKDNGALFDEGPFNATLSINPCAAEIALFGLAESDTGSGLGEDESDCRSEALLALNVGKPLVLDAVRFGCDSDLSNDPSNGPFPVFDYRDGVLRGDGAHWTRAIGPIQEMVIPAAFLKGSPTFVGANFSRPNFPADTFRLRFTLRDPSGEREFFNPITGTDFVDSAPDRIPFHITFVSSTPLPDAVGRHSLRLIWTVRAMDLQDHQLGPALEFRTPDKRRVHMLYGLLGKPGAGVSANPDRARNAWYSPTHCDDEIATFDTRASGPHDELTRSPLDLATTWGAGATDEATAIELITTHMNKHSFQYIGRTDFTVFKTTLNPFGSATSQIFWSDMLRNAYGLQCSDFALVLAVMANNVGVSSIPIKRADGQGKPLFTNYLSMADGKNRNIQSVLAPKNVSQKFFGLSFSPKVIFNGLGPRFAQFDFTFHQYVLFNGLVFDASSAFDKDAYNPDNTLVAARMNRDYYLNQLSLGNMILSFFMSSHQEVYNRAADPNVFHRGALDYANQFQAVQDTRRYSESQYRERLLYLSTSPNLRTTTGYNTGTPTNESVQTRIVWTP